MAWEFKVIEVPSKGRGVFVGDKPIPAGAIVLRFEGPIFSKATCPAFPESLQVGLDAWMWSSGGVDDLVNHSCGPNTGLVTLGGGHFLVALRDIAQGEELTFDYSTSMVGEPVDIEHCRCGARECRGVVSDFFDLPAHVQCFYASRGALPDHVLEAAAAAGVPLPTPARVPGGSDSPVAILSDDVAAAMAKAPPPALALQGLPVAARA